MTKTKVCTKCGRRKRTSAFNAHPTNRDRLYSNCKACAAEYGRRWRADNPERAAEIARRSRAANPERRAELTRRWHADNPERAAEYKRRSRAADPERHARLIRRWYADNQGKGAAYVAARRAAKLRATPPWADPKKIGRIYARARTKGLSVDHIVPLRSPLVCGLHCEANLRAYPLSKNSVKGNRSWPDMPRGN